MRLGMPEKSRGGGGGHRFPLRLITKCHLPCMRTPSSETGSDIQQDGLLGDATWNSDIEDDDDQSSELDAHLSLFSGVQGQNRNATLEMGTHMTVSYTDDLNGNDMHNTTQHNVTESHSSGLDNYHHHLAEVDHHQDNHRESGASFDHLTSQSANGDETSGSAGWTGPVRSGNSNESEYGITTDERDSPVPLRRSPRLRSARPSSHGGDMRSTEPEGSMSPRNSDSQLQSIQSIETRPWSQLQMLWGNAAMSGYRRLWQRQNVSLQFNPGAGSSAAEAAAASTLAAPANAEGSRQVPCVSRGGLPRSPLTPRTFEQEQSCVLPTASTEQTDDLIHTRTSFGNIMASRHPWRLPRPRSAARSPLSRTRSPHPSVARSPRLPLVRSPSNRESRSSVTESSVTASTQPASLFSQSNTPLFFHSMFDATLWQGLASQIEDSNHDQQASRRPSMGAGDDWAFGASASGQDHDAASADSASDIAAGSMFDEDFLAHVEAESGASSDAGSGLGHPAGSHHSTTDDSGSIELPTLPAVTPNTSVPISENFTTDRGGTNSSTDDRPDNSDSIPGRGGGSTVAQPPPLPAIESGPSSPESTSSRSRPQQQWYFYDPRLVSGERAPQRLTVSTSYRGVQGQISMPGIVAPPGYDEAMDATSPPDVEGLLTERPPSGSPPPYSEPPPSYEQTLENDLIQLREDTNNTETDTGNAGDRQVIGAHAGNEPQNFNANNSPCAAPPSLQALFNNNPFIEPTIQEHSPDPEPDLDLLNDLENEYGAEGTSESAAVPPNSRVPVSSGLFQMGGRPPIRWSRGMGLERWTSSFNWAV